MMAARAALIPRHPSGYWLLSPAALQEYPTQVQANVSASHSKHTPAVSAYTSSSASVVAIRTFGNLISPAPYRSSFLSFVSPSPGLNPSNNPPYLAPYQANIHLRRSTPSHCKATDTMPATQHNSGCVLTRNKPTSLSTSTQQQQHSSHRRSSINDSSMTHLGMLHSRCVHTSGVCRLALGMNAAGPWLSRSIAKLIIDSCPGAASGPRTTKSVE